MAFPSVVGRVLAQVQDGQHQSSYLRADWREHIGTLPDGFCIVQIVVCWELRSINKLAQMLWIEA